MNKKEEECFKEIVSTFKTNITQWDYFVNWEKVFKNVSAIEMELNLLNYIIGKKDLKKAFIDLVSKYPTVIQAIPILLAIREKSINVLIDIKKFIYKNFDFSKNKYSKEEIEAFANFVIESGLEYLLKDKKIKNLVDYAIGVEVGLDSNGRKNRTGKLMEKIVEEFIRDTCNDLNIEYISQANKERIKNKWNIEIEIDKSSRIIDFAINDNGKLYFIEVNFYNTGGSKLKSTATEYIRMNKFWNKQDIEFIWITDGEGWLSTLKPLREYFDKADYLLNLELLSKGILKRILIYERTNRN